MPGRERGRTLEPLLRGVPGEPPRSGVARYWACRQVQLGLSRSVE